MGDCDYFPCGGDDGGFRGGDGACLVLDWSVVMFWNDNEFFPWTAAVFFVLAAAGEVGVGSG